ncbi:MAG: hypothetical protein HYS12_16045 [Planctomycetes bacterium]|nr:hypothetical protein [Planctomycetota bacterium]
MRDTDPVSPEEPPVTADVESLTQQLLAPFESNEVKFKPAVVTGNRALALPYVDARVIQDRLDEVLGVAGWQDEYECLPDGSVVCRLRLRLGSEWITKMDVGGPSEQPDEGDRRKAAFSDALKRAAVKFGVARYLYRLAPLWVDWDAQKKKFLKDPQLPASALPRKADLRVPVRNGTAPAEKQPETVPTPAVAARDPLARVPRPTAAAASIPAPAGKKSNGKGKSKAAPTGLPANGAELRQRLYAYDARLASQKLCQPGDLVKHIVAAGQKAGHDTELDTWSEPAIVLAVEETKAFEAACRQSSGPRKEVA